MSEMWVFGKRHVMFETVKGRNASSKYVSVFQDMPDYQ